MLFIGKHRIPVQVGEPEFAKELLVSKSSAQEEILTSNALSVRNLKQN